MHGPEENPTPEPILPPAVLVNTIQWALDDQIHLATQTEPTPLGGPEGKTYVPTSLRSSLLGSLHASPGSCHPGSQRTPSLLQARYWWPSMAQDISQYICGCSVCAITNTPRRLPEAKLVPLPIPHRPWSHLVINFMTDFPSSYNHSCVFCRC